MAVIQQLPAPLVNGVRTQHSNIQVRLNGQVYFVKSVNWDHSLEPGVVKANLQEPIGWTDGEYKSTFNFELYKAEGDAFESDLMADPTYQMPDGSGHLGYMQIFFPVIIFHRKVSAVSLTEIDFFARITKDADSSTVGVEAHARKYDCVTTPIAKDGRFAFAGQSGL